jgi:hypothetical protein
MKFLETRSLIYNNAFAREAWFNGQQVWPPYTNCYTWTKKPLATTFWLDIVYGPVNTLVATGVNVYSYSLNNGDTWSTPAVINPDAGNEYFNAVAYGNNMWSMVEFLPAGVGNGSKFFYTSVNMLTGWTKIPFANTTLNPLLSNFHFAESFFNPYNNKFIAFTDQRNLAGNDCNACAIYSDDGVIWLSAGYVDQNGARITAPQGFGQGAAIGTNMPNNRLATCGNGGSHKFAYSDNGGLTWIQGNYNPGPTGQNLAVGFGGNQIAYGYDNNQYLPLSGRYVVPNVFGTTNTYQFAYSDDGIGWIGVSCRNSPSLSANLCRDWSCVAYANGKFVALSNAGGYQAVSRDGINWTGCQNMPTATSNKDIVVANNRFVAVVDNEAGNNNAVIANFI